MARLLIAAFSLSLLVACGDDNADGGNATPNDGTADCDAADWSCDAYCDNLDTLCDDTCLGAQDPQCETAGLLCPAACEAAKAAAQAAPELRAVYNCVTANNECAPYIACLGICAASGE